MSKGIYLFWDNKYEQVIYAGRFSSRKRIKDHFQPSMGHVQKINEYIQNHPDRIESVIFCEFDDISDDDLNQLEIETIKLFKLNRYKYPNSHVFNFTDGGEGVTGYRKSHEDFEYTVAKCGFGNGKQNYCIYDKDNKPIKISIDKKALDEIVVLLNNDKITEEEIKAWKYTVAKSGFRNGKQKYCIYDRDAKPIKTSIDKKALDEIVVLLNNRKITEEEAKAINLNPFEYTVTKASFENGKRRYTIYDRSHKQIKKSINKEALDEIADALNNNKITEKQVKSIRGVDKVIELIQSL